MYGFNWWFNADQSNWPDARQSFQANGHYGIETMSMIPSRSVVIATHGGNMGSHATGADDAMNENLKLLTQACPPPVLTGYSTVGPTNSARMVYSTK